MARGRDAGIAESARVGEISVASLKPRADRAASWPNTVHKRQRPAATHSADSSRRPRRGIRSASRELARSRNTGRSNNRDDRALVRTRRASVAGHHVPPAMAQNANDGDGRTSAASRAWISPERANERARIRSPLTRSPIRAGANGESRCGTPAPAGSARRTSTAGSRREQDVESSGSCFANVFDRVTESIAQEYESSV